MMKEHEDDQQISQNIKEKKSLHGTFSIGELAHERRFSNTAISNDNVFESIFLSGCIHDVTLFVFVCFLFFGGISVFVRQDHLGLHNKARKKRRGQSTTQQTA